MSTLAEASHTTKRNRTFAGRPQHIQSGNKLKKVQPVGNRSDILLDDQIFIVKDLQDALENAMYCYGNAKTEDDIMNWKVQVNDLKEKSDEMVLVLKVVDKINRELMYARDELTKSAKTGQNVQLARKRVIWLEDRKEKLLLKYRRPRSSIQKELEVSAFLDDIDSDNEFAENTAQSIDGALPDPYSSNYRQNTISSIDPILPSSTVHRHHIIQTDKSFVSEMSRNVAGKPEQRHLSRERPTKENAGAIMKPEKSILKSSQTYRGYGDAGLNQSETNPYRHREQTEVSVYPLNSVTTASTPEIYSEISDSRPTTKYRRSREKSTFSNQEVLLSRASDRGVFITEEIEDEKVSRKVSVMSPEKFSDSEDDEEPTTDGVQAPPSRGRSIRSVQTDATEEYWMSDHHRFEYNQFYDALTKNNPLSYHSLGLAVQSTFMSPASAGCPELPWSDGNAGGNMGDAQIEGKIALDKLCERIHKIYSKVDGAAIQSVQMSPGEPLERESTLLNSMEGRLILSPTQKYSLNSKPESRRSMRNSGMEDDTDTIVESTAGSKGRSSETRSANTRGQADLSIVISEPVKQSASVGLGLLYHPPAIPAPEVLPLTRTNPNKSYPRISSDWNDVDPEPIVPTIRLVNQMNVAKETSLLLYKNKESKRSGFTLPVKKTPIQKMKLNKVTLAKHPIMIATKFASMIASRHRANALKLDKDSLKWKRIENLIYENLISGNVLERRDASMHLGSLMCVNEEVFAALILRVQEDKDEKVCYESSKSLVVLGCWRAVPIQALLKYLKSHGPHIQQDILRTIIRARNVHLVNKNLPCVKELIKVLKQLCRNKSELELGYDSAVCLGCLCEQDATAKTTLLGSLTSKHSHVRAQSLEVLVRQMHATDPEVVKTILYQLETSPVAKDRSAAAKLLVYLGPVSIPNQETADKVFNVLEQRLYNDPVKDVRFEIAKTLTGLGMKPWLMDIVENRLEDDDCNIRISAVISVGVLGMKSDKVMRLLMDMVELDSSDYIRLMVIRTFAQLGTTNIKILRSLKDKERSGGPLGREAANALKILLNIKSSQGQRHSPRNIGHASPPRSPSLPNSPIRTKGPSRTRSLTSRAKSPNKSKCGSRKKNRKNRRVAKSKLSGLSNDDVANSIDDTNVLEINDEGINNDHNSLGIGSEPNQREISDEPNPLEISDELNSREISNENRMQFSDEPNPPEIRC